MQPEAILSFSFLEGVQMAIWKYPTLGEKHKSYLETSSPWYLGASIENTGSEGWRDVGCRRIPWMHPGQGTSEVAHQQGTSANRWRTRCLTNLLPYQPILCLHLWDQSEIRGWTMLPLLEQRPTKDKEKVREENLYCDLVVKFPISGLKIISSNSASIRSKGYFCSPFASSLFYLSTFIEQRG
jgi:hypothetical protein